MSIHPGQPSSLRALTIQQYAELEHEDLPEYGELVAAVAEYRNVTALEAKEYISRTGRKRAAEEVGHV